MGGTGDEAGLSKLPGKSTKLLSRAKIENFQGENDLQKRVRGGCERPSRMVP